MKTSPSTLGRLLEEISWAGNAKPYREGGRGFENVLTAEVFQALDFLPRTEFFARVFASAGGGASRACSCLAREAEQATFGLLPGAIALSENPPLLVQPDGIIQSPSVHCLVEAKRMKAGSFQPEQLARELLACLQEADGRTPLLLLVLPKPPPVSVKGHGRLPVREAVAKWLPRVLGRAEGEFPPAEELVERVDSIVAYTTWGQIAKDVEDGLEAFGSAGPSVLGSVSRIAETVREAIEWHR